MRKEKSCYYSNKLTETKDTKGTWKILNESSAKQTEEGLLYLVNRRCINDGND